MNWRQALAWTKKPDRWMVGLLVLMAFAKGLLWLGSYPIFKIADEPAHFDNIQYRAEHHQWAPVSKRPVEKVISSTASAELRAAWTATQRYHREKHSRYFPMVEEEPKLARMAKDEKNRLSDGQMPALMYPGVYYGLGTIPYLFLQTRSILNRVFAVRALSMLFGICAVLATFFAARATFDAPELAFAAACVVCMQPMFSQQTAAVNNDAALIGCCSLSFALQVILLVRGRPSLLFGALVGFSIGLSIMSKPQGWEMLFTGLLVFVWLSRKNGRAAWRLWAGAAAAGAVVLLVVALWPSEPEPATPPPIAAVAATVKPPTTTVKKDEGPLTQLVDELVGFPGWVDRLDPGYREYLFRSAFGQFSWLEFSIPAYWTNAVRDLLPICVAGLIIALVLRLVRPPSEAFFWITGPVVLAAITMFCDVVGVLFVEYHLRSGKPFVGVIQGRNFLFAIPAFAILVVVGLGSIVPRKLRGLTAAMIVTASVCLNLASLICIVRQHYGG